MSYDTDQQIIDAENKLVYYQRGLRVDGILFGRADVESLVATLEQVLDKYAELAVAFEPQDDPDADYFLDPFDQEVDESDEQLDPYP